MTASSFFISLAAGSPLVAQRIEAYAVGSGIVSSDLVRDDVATPALRQLLGGELSREVTARAAPGPALAAGVRFPASPRVGLELEAGWAPAPLEVTEDGETRHVQDLHVLYGLLGANWLLRDGLELGGAAGAVGYLTEDRGLFAEGSGLAPALRGHVGLRLPFLDQRLSLRGAVELHRFGTPAIRRVGGEDGYVTRFQLGARIRLTEVSR